MVPWVRWFSRRSAKPYTLVRVQQEPLKILHHAGIAQWLVHRPSKPRMTVRFCLPAQQNILDMSSEMTTFLIWLGTTAVLAGVLFAVPPILRKCKIKKLAVGQYYDSFVNSEEPYIVKIVSIDREEGKVIYQTTDRGEVITSIDKFIQSFDKMSDKQVKKYQHLLPA